jgi:hypothetical protein
MPNHWSDDNDKQYSDEFFNDKKYEDLYFDNFFDMDQMFGHENSLFGTRGLPVGHPKRTSKSFNLYNERFGPMVVRVVKDKNLQEQINRIQSMMGVINEGLHDTSWENEEGEKITLMDLLNATEDIPVENISVEALKPHLLTWDGDEDEIKKIESSDLQYPILIFVDNGGEFISIIDGHHRAQKAVRKGLETIKAKVIPINSLPKDIRKVFGHMGRQEEMKEGELTERCWTGYTQKGMKTMFGKRYPNCVKIKKK